MTKLINASGTVYKLGNKVENFWSKLFAKALKDKNVSDLLVSTGGSAQQT